MDIKIFEEFISQEESNLLISYINNNLSIFQQSQENKYFTLMFGKDNYFSEISNRFLYMEENIKKISIKYFNKTINQIQHAFNDFSQMYVSSFWLAKQTSGAYLGIHSDNDNGNNLHFNYSAGLYLNDIENEGELWFPKLQYKYKPKCGDLVCWPSQSLDHDHGIQKIISDRYTMLMWLTKDPDYAIEY